VDVSADFRLDTPESYRRWYGEEHGAPELLGEAVYGLSELYREEIAGARLVANPGCYPTSAILGLYPLAREGCLAEGPVIVDAKSGISGAGRSPNPRNLFVEVNENVVPYSIGHSHRHVGEMEQELAKVMGRSCQVVFSPQLVPLNQGILSTIYVELAEPMPEGEVLALYRECYRRERFILLLEGKPAHLKYTFANNMCAIGITQADEVGRHQVITSAIDNLIKGAAGQAVQNMNIMFGLPEDMGLI
jgi:N-acetyl-gamma-glutamyl-phosphate reductase